MHPNSPSYRIKTQEQLFEMQEKEKKRAYLERVIQVEKGSFTPLIFSTFGGMGKEAKKHHKRIAQLIAEKKNESYAEVMNHLRTRLRFSLLKSILVAIRGVRGKMKVPEPVASVEFSLVEQGREDF